MNLGVWALIVSALVLVAICILWPVFYPDPMPNEREKV